MRTYSAVIVIVTTLLVGSPVVQAAPQPAVSGTITRVTVYRGQALVTRNIEVEAPAGSSELVVQNLPANIVPESIYAEISGQAKVLSVRYREQAVQEDTREEVRQLDRQAQQLAQQLKYAASELELLKKQWEMYEKLKDFSITAAGVDRNRGVLTFEPLKNLTDLIENKGAEYLKHQLELEDKTAEIKKNQDLLDRKRKELTAGRSRTERQALLFVTQDQAARVTIQLSYLVRGANWQQQYNLRATPKESSVLIEYNAVVNQASGEDWAGVQLSLSTAEPMMVAAAPVLDPMVVGLISPAVAQQRPQPQGQQAGQQAQSFEQMDIKQLQQSRKSLITKGLSANTELNALAIRNQLIFFNARQDEAAALQKQMASIGRTEGVSVAYQLPGTFTLPSRSDQQLVTIAAIRTKADFRLVATPLLTDYVYLQADVANSSQTVLLPGEASMFRDGDFVGKSQIPQVTIGERFTAGFGIDSQIRIQHELEEKTTRIQGGNQIDTYRYRIALSNYKNAAVELRLLDRLPYTEDSSVKIDLAKSDPALSTDAEYLRTGRKKGILRWDLQLAANTVDQKATIVTYSYTMEYDRNMRIEPLRSSNVQ